MSRRITGARGVASVALLAGILASSVAWALPVETLVPAQNHPSGTVSTSGTGFGASEAVDLFFDTSDLQLAVTDGSGKFAATVLTVPSGATPGTHWVTAIGRHSGFAAQKAFTVSTNWPKQGAGPTNQSANSYENVLSTANVSGLDLLWRTDTGGPIYSSPTFFNGRLYVGSYDHKLYALNPDTGAILWSVTTGGNIYGGPTIVNNIVYVGVTDGKVYAYNAATGAALWTYTTGDAIYGAVTVVNGLLYIVSYDGHLYALNASTGALVWKQPVAGFSYPTPCVANGVVYTPDSGGTIYANNAATGALLWTTGGGVGVPGSITASNGRLFYATPSSAYGDAFLVGLNARTAQFAVATNLSYGHNYSISGSPAIANGVVFIGNSYGILTAISAHTSGIIWTSYPDSSDVTYGIADTPAVANGVLYYASLNGTIFAADASNGAHLWTAETGDQIVSSPAVVNGHVYVGSVDGSLYAFALGTAGPALAPRPSIAALRALQPRQ